MVHGTTCVTNMEDYQSIDKKQPAPEKLLYCLGR